MNKFKKIFFYIIKNVFFLFFAAIARAHAALAAVAGAHGAPAAIAGAPGAPAAITGAHGGVP